MISGIIPPPFWRRLRALRIRYAKEKIWAVFEPRSNTTRRNVFQTELASAFADADAVVVAEVARLEQLPAGERLNPKKLMQDIKASGKAAAYLPDADAIVAYLAKHALGGEVVVVFSNGGFRRHPRKTAGTAGAAISDRVGFRFQRQKRPHLIQMRP